MQGNFNKKITKDDERILRFLEKYKIIKVEDCSLIYKTKKYYRLRVNKLIKNGYVKRYNKYIILDKKGRKYLDIVGSNYIKNMDNKPYMERLKMIGRIATLTIDTDIKFYPSWELKEKERFTENARKYLGIIKYNSEDYYIYYISKSKVHVYIKQIMFDIKKLNDNANVIIILDDYRLINKNYSYLSFNNKNTYIVLNKNENRDFVRNYNDFDFYSILEKTYKSEILMSSWMYADYMVDNINILKMMFLNTQTLRNLNWYYTENEYNYKKLDIFTLNENKEIINELLNNKCNIITFNTEDLLGGKNIEFEESEEIT